MAKKNNKISITNKLIIITFGILMILIGFTIEDLVIRVGGSNITYQIIAIVTLVAVIIEYSNLGIKPNNIMGQIRRFGNKERITFVIATLVGIYAIANLFGWQGFLSFTGGQLIVIGFLTILNILFK